MTATAEPLVTGPVSPVRGVVEVLDRAADGTARAAVTVDADEPVFAGHYPDFPIFPGVCLIDCAHRAALATADRPLVLASVESARFSAAVFPGTRVTYELKWSDHRAGGLRCAARAVTDDGVAATVRLHYLDPGTPLPRPAVPPLPAGSTAGLPEPAALLPHRYPMLLVDRMRSITPGERVTASRTVTQAEPWYTGRPVGADPAYPPALLIESWGQSAGLLVAAGSPVRDDQVMLFGAVSGATFHAPVRPGDRVEHHVRQERAVGDSVSFAGETWCRGRLVMTLDRMVMAIRPAGALRPGADGPEVTR